jgi:hypothetical protein
MAVAYVPITKFKLQLRAMELELNMPPNATEVGSREYRNYRACARKRKYTLAEAQARAEEVKITDPRGHLLNAYKCPTCEEYHIGHKDQE